MKKFLITMLGLLVILSCGQKPKSSSYDDDEEDEEEVREELKLKTYKFSETDGMAHVDISVEYPVKGETKLVDAIRTHIANHVELESDEVELSDGQGVIDYYGKNLMNEMRSLASDYEGDDYVTEVYHNWTFTKLCETDEFVTFMGETELYEGGVHGIEYQAGVTFFQNGQVFDYSMLRNTDSEAFQKLMRDGLCIYFKSDGEAISEEQLAEELINVEDVYNIPMPSAEPYITEDGVKFIYQPYEISYYGAGKPEFSIKLEKMKPYLTRKAQELLEGDEEDDEDEEDDD